MQPLPPQNVNLTTTIGAMQASLSDESPEALKAFAFERHKASSDFHCHVFFNYRRSFLNQTYQERYARLPDLSLMRERVAMIEEAQVGQLRLDGGSVTGESDSMTKLVLLEPGPEGLVEHALSQLDYAILMAVQTPITVSDLCQMLRGKYASIGRMPEVDARTLILKRLRHMLFCGVVRFRSRSLLRRTMHALGLAPL